MAPWQQLAEQHRNGQQAAIPKAWIIPDSKISQLVGAGTPSEGSLITLKAAQESGLLSPLELEITEKYDASDLIQKMASGELTAEDVTVAFCKRAAIAQQLTSCLTEIFFEEAIARAKELDTQFKDTGKTAGPFHGLPISMKDSFCVKGHHSTMGYVANISRPAAADNSPLVDMLLEDGAVLYCKTNIPQTLMTADSENNIFGRTLNPHKTSLTAGGSSGGEGAIVAFRASPLGVGTDIAGSIRIPSLCCGVYGFKPTADRIPYGGQGDTPFPAVHLPGTIVPCAGPLANSVQDLEFFMKTVIDKQPWRYDHTSFNVGWRSLESSADKALTIGVLPEDPEYPFSPPVRRCLDGACASLAAAGHKLVYIPEDKLSSAGLAGRLAYQFYALSPSGFDSREEIIGEPQVTSVAKGVHPFSQAGFPVDPALGLEDKFHQLNGARDAFAKAWQKIWRDNDLDVVLAPGANTTAVPHDAYGVPVYTMIWNLLNASLHFFFPAGIIPYGKSSKELDSTPFKPTAPFEAEYDPQAWDGAPCAIQVVAPSFKDEECLKAMRLIDQALHRT
ncbi:hypothetical protein PFICI_06506 [Pestalotiopsis fici W106-1]|uniref:amidase n=1 Tax=Pestalotiopsis fici (strain W106-1 / CGMCC3.15140) TaxID=1229662 RepID=W3X641_PESFW|nr:uncharacterized protein PFICI_06506 [Pestalotiopsis fici W106-1]ETS81504.1 hypothetical protein PFICI_06506 [Pestalotiopsis fici W106-1]